MFEINDHAADQLAELAITKAMMDIFIDTSSNRFAIADDTASALILRVGQLGTDKIQAALVYSDLAGLLADISSMNYGDFDVPSYLSVVFSLTAMRLMDASVIEAQQEDNPAEEKAEVPEEAASEDTPEAAEESTQEGSVTG
jgi:hypothetical protein